MKGLSESGIEVVAVPYIGRKVDTLWWKAYENPNLLKYLVYEKLEGYATRLGVYKNKMDFRSKNKKIIDPLIRALVTPKWKKLLTKLLKTEGDIDAVLVLTVPLNHLVGLPRLVKMHCDAPVIFYDGDTPTSLPKYGGLSLSYYEGVDLSEYDAFIVNSRGVISELSEMGVSKVYTVYWGVDPSFFFPVSIGHDINVSFFGVGSKLREEWIYKMMSKPSEVLKEYAFGVEGKGFEVDLGRVVVYNGVPYRDFCCRSDICLNIVRRPHASVYGSAISRIFELASMGCCTVSNPCLGIEEWFTVGKEILVVNDEEEAIETYKWLLSETEVRRKFGEAARQRVLKEHTIKHRVDQLISIIKELM